MKNERVQAPNKFSHSCMYSMLADKCEWMGNASERTSKRTREVSVDALRLDIFMSYQSIFVGIILFSFLMSKQREAWQECEIGSKYGDGDDEEVRCECV